MRVLHVGKFFPPYAGGMEVFVADLAAAQRLAGDEVEVLVHGTPQDDDPPWLTRVPVWREVVYAPVAPGFPLALGRLLKRFRPDVLHLHMPNPSAFSVLLLSAARRVPWVVHWHADVVAAEGGRAISHAYRAYQPFERVLLARAARVLATSAPYLHASKPLQPWRSKCAVVPLGIDTTRYPPQSVDDPGWGEQGLRLLALGRLSHYKDFGTLVRAVSGLEGVRLLLAGDGEQRAELAALATRSEGRVTLLGEVSDARKASLLASCDALCLPSIERSEAFGVVLLEAMRYGKPCIVSDLAGSGMPWVVAQAGAGLRVPVRNIAAWQQAILELRDQPERAREMGESGRQALSRDFSIAACAGHVRHEYRLAGCPEPLPEASRGLLVVIPARDEASTIAEVVADLKRSGYDDVVVVDDGSRDDTARLARKAGAVVLRAPLALGAWGAMQTGIRYALAHGHAEVVTMDADGQHEVAEIPALLAARDAGAEVVIGAYPERGSLARRLAWWWFRKLTGFSLEDLTSGFRYYNRRAMQVAVSESAILLDYQDIGVLLLLRRAGLKAVEVPVSMNVRVAGQSRIFNSWLTVARYMAVSSLLCVARWRAPAGFLLQSGTRRGR